MLGKSKAQGALEYLIILVAVLAVSTVVISFSLNVFGVQKDTVSTNACKQAASKCKVIHYSAPASPCPECDAACEGLGESIINCCVSGQPGLIYDGSLGCEEPTQFCSDGTPYGWCSESNEYLGKRCVDGQFVWDCAGGCTCAPGWTCDDDANECFVQPEEEPWLSATILEPTSPKYVPPASDFTVTSQVTCMDNTCNNVVATLRYNATGANPTTSVSTGSGEPLSTTTNPLTTCGTLLAGQSCTVGWSVNANSEGSYMMDVIFTATNPDFDPFSTNTVDFKVGVLSPEEVELFYDEFSNLDLWVGQKSAAEWHVSTDPYNLTTSAGKYGYGAAHINRSISTVGYADIGVSFYAKSKHVTDPTPLPGEFMRVDWWDGIAWNNLLNTHNVLSYTRYDYSLPASASNNPKFKIRLYCYNWHDYVYFDVCNIDTLRVTGTPT